MENMEEKTKVCRVCGNEKPLSEFHANNAAKDGHVSRCKDCVADYYKSYAERKQMGGVVVDENNPLSAYHPRELIAELRRRVYVGELKFTQTIKV